MGVPSRISASRNVVGRAILIGRFGCSVCNYAEFPECHVSMAEDLEIVVKIKLNHNPNYRIR